VHGKAAKLKGVIDRCAKTDADVDEILRRYKGIVLPHGWTWRLVELGEG
jgi:hypothetical protein